MMKDTPDIESLFARAALPRLPAEAKTRILAAVEDETRPVIPLFLKLAVAASLVIAVTLNIMAEHHSRAFTQSLANTPVITPLPDPLEMEFQGLNLRPLIAVRQSTAPTDWKKQAQEIETLLREGGSYDI